MGFLDNIMEKLQQDSSVASIKKRLSEFLKNIYLENIQVIKYLEKEIQVNPYPHISKQIEEVLKEEQRDNDIIKLWLTEFGLDPNALTDTIPDEGYHNLGSSIENRMESYELMVEILNLLDNAHLEKEYETLKKIKENMLRHISTLENLMTKFNG